MSVSSYAERIAEISGANANTVREVLEASYGQRLLFHAVDPVYLARVARFGLQPIAPDKRYDNSSSWAGGVTLFLDPNYEPMVFEGKTYDMEGLGTLFFDRAHISPPGAVDGIKRAALVVTDRWLLQRYNIPVIGEDPENPDVDVVISGAVPKNVIDLVDVHVDVSEYPDSREGGKRLERELLDAVRHVSQLPPAAQRGRIIRRTEMGLFSVERSG